MALEMNPKSLAALQNKAHIQSEVLGDTDGCLETLSTILTLDPDFELARAGRAVLFGRKNNLPAAIADIEWLLRTEEKHLLPSTLFQIGCTYGLLSSLDEKYVAMCAKFLTKSIQRGYGLDLLKSDPDLDSLRSYPDFQRVEALASLLAEARR